MVISFILLTYSDDPDDDNDRDNDDKGDRFDADGVGDDDYHNGMLDELIHPYSHISTLTISLERLPRFSHVHNLIYSVSGTSATGL